MARRSAAALKMVVDTMVFAYALLASHPHREEALRILEVCEEVIVPDSIRAELVNTIWQYIRSKDVPVDVGIELLRDAESLFSRVENSRALWERALRLAVSSSHPAYDTLFVALAELSSTKVVTYDEKLLRTFPDHCISAAAFLASEKS
jgi:predicted nucleic acid-binding protein